MHKISIGLLFVIGMVAPAAAETMTFEAARVSIELPDGWHSSTRGATLTLADRHENVAVSFSPIGAGAVKQATKSVAQYLEKTVVDLKFGAVKEITVNGMPAVAIPGEGVLQGKSIHFAVLILDTPSENKDLLVLAIGEVEKIAKHQAEINFVFDHLKPIH